MPLLTLFWLGEEPPAKIGYRKKGYQLIGTLILTSLLEGLDLHFCQKGGGGEPAGFVDQGVTPKHLDGGEFPDV